MTEIDKAYSPEEKARLRDSGLNTMQLHAEKLIKLKEYVHDASSVKMAVVIRNFVMRCLETAPLYFWYMPSSTTGKYHPQWGLGEAGLVRHTIFGAHMASEFAATFGLSELDTLLAVAAMFIHDTCKLGLDDEPDIRYYDAHPVLPRLKYAAKTNRGIQLHKELPAAWADTIFACIERHMGSIAKGDWVNIGSAARPTLRPETPMEQVVHLADYVASRKEVYFSDFLPSEITEKVGV